MSETCAVCGGTTFRLSTVETITDAEGVQRQVCDYCARTIFYAVLGRVIPRPS